MKRYSTDERSHAQAERQRQDADESTMIERAEQSAKTKVCPTCKGAGAVDKDGKHIWGAQPDHLCPDCHPESKTPKTKCSHEKHVRAGK